MTQPVECPGGGNLHTHKELGYGEDAQIIYAHRQKLRLCDKDAKNRFREGKEYECGKSAPQKDNGHGTAIAFADADLVPGTEILCHKGIDSSRETV